MRPLNLLAECAARPEGNAGSEAAACRGPILRREGGKKTVNAYQVVTGAKAT